MAGRAFTTNSHHARAPEDLNLSIPSEAVQPTGPISPAPANTLQDITSMSSADIQNQPVHPLLDRMQYPVQTEDYNINQADEHTNTMLTRREFIPLDAQNGLTMTLGYGNGSMSYGCPSGAPASNNVRW